MCSSNIYFIKSEDYEYRNHLNHNGNYEPPSVTLLQPCTLHAQCTEVFHKSLETKSYNLPEKYFCKDETVCFLRVVN